MLQKPAGIKTAVAQIRQMLSDYLGSAGSQVEIVCTECNSVNAHPGKQTTSLINGLFLADSIAQGLQTELGSLLWWELHSVRNVRPDNPDLFGWRPYRDFGLLSGHESPDVNTPYPTYFTASLLQYWARGRDRVVSAASNYGLLSVYAVRRQKGPLTLLVINKSPSKAMQTDIQIRDFLPAKAGNAYVYGIPQDTGIQTGIGSTGIALTSFEAATAFSYTFPPYSATVLSFPSRTQDSKR